MVPRPPVANVSSPMERPRPIVGKRATQAAWYLRLNADPGDVVARAHNAAQGPFRAVHEARIRAEQAQRTSAHDARGTCLSRESRTYGAARVRRSAGRRFHVPSPVVSLWEGRRRAPLCGPSLIEGTITTYPLSAIFARVRTRSPRRPGKKGRRRPPRPRARLTKITAVIAVATKDSLFSMRLRVVSESSRFRQTSLKPPTVCRHRRRKSKALAASGGRCGTPRDGIESPRRTLPAPPPRWVARAVVRGGKTQSGRFRLAEQRPRSCNSSRISCLGKPIHQCGKGLPILDSGAVVLAELEQRHQFEPRRLLRSSLCNRPPSRRAGRGGLATRTGNPSLNHEKLRQVHALVERLRDLERLVDLSLGHLQFAREQQGFGSIAEHLASACEHPESP